MSKQRNTKNTRRKEAVPRSPRGQISCVVRASKQIEHPGWIRINIPGDLRKSQKQEVVLPNLPATSKNLAAVHGALEKINARIHLLQDLDVKEMSKQDLKDYILEQLEQPKQLKARLNAGVELDALLLDYIEYARTHLKRSEATLSIYITVHNAVARLTTKELSYAEQIIGEFAKLEYGLYYRNLQKLSICCNWAVEKGKILKNPFLSVLEDLKEPKHSDKHPDPFSRQAMEIIIERYCYHPRYYYYADLVEFYFLTGARTGEAVALQWGDVDFEKGVIYIRKTIKLVRGKPDLRDETKTGTDREFPIEDPDLQRLLKRLWSPNKKPDDFVFQEPDGSHVDRRKFYYSWYGQKKYDSIENENREVYFVKGIVSKLAALGEKRGGIDHYRPQYNTRHTFINLTVEGMVELNQSTARDIKTLSEYIGNNPKVIFEHYLAGSGNRRLVVVSSNHREFRTPDAMNEENSKDRAAQSQQVMELELHNSRLQSILQSLVQFVNAALLQFVPEALRAQLSEFITKLVGNDFPNPISHSSESVEALDEEIAKCAALLTLEFNSDS